jgi:hypothetical protein
MLLSVWVKPGWYFSPGWSLILIVHSCQLSKPTVAHVSFGVGIFRCENAVFSQSGERVSKFPLERVPTAFRPRSDRVPTAFRPRSNRVRNAFGTRSERERSVKAFFHCSRFVRAGGAGFENLLTRAWREQKTMNASPARAKRTLMANGLYDTT